MAVWGLHAGWERRQLLRAGIPLSLEPKAYELLGLLLARRPRALSKDQIHGVLWAGTFVSESALPGLVADLRSVLGDDARRPRFIRTVHGYGYAFCGEAREDGEPRVTPTEPVLRALSPPGLANPECSNVRSTRVPPPSRSPPERQFMCSSSPRARGLPLFSSSWPASPSQHRFCSPVVPSTSLVMAPMDEATGWRGWPMGLISSRGCPNRLRFSKSAVRAIRF